MIGCSIRRLARASLLPMICPCMVIGVVPWQNHGNFVSKALEPRSPKKTLYQTGYAVMNGPSGLFWHFLLGSFLPRQISCLVQKRRSETSLVEVKVYEVKLVSPISIPTVVTRFGMGFSRFFHSLFSLREFSSSKLCSLSG